MIELWWSSAAVALAVLVWVASSVVRFYIDTMDGFFSGFSRPRRMERYVFNDEDDDMSLPPVRHFPDMSAYTDDGKLKRPETASERLARRMTELNIPDNPVKHIQCPGHVYFMRNHNLISYHALVRLAGEIVGDIEGTDE